MLNFNSLIIYLNTLSPLIIWAALFFFCYFTILLTFKYAGQFGLYTYIITAVIVGNLQVLKLVQFTLFPDPIALGTIVFTSTFLCTDILYEFYGKEAAKRGVMLGFIGYFLFTCFMFFAVAFAPLQETTPDLAWGIENHHHMLALFLPAPAFFLAGMIAYVVSQSLDILVYDKINEKTAGKKLWLRNNVATIISCFVDNAIFSILAWVVFGPYSLSNESLTNSFILGLFMVRVVIAFLDTPFLYWAKKITPPKV